MPPAQRSASPSNGAKLIEALWPEEKSHSQQDGEFATEVSSAMIDLNKTVKPWRFHLPVGLYLLKKIEPSPSMTFDDLSRQVLWLYEQQQPGETLTPKTVQDVTRRLVRCWTMTTIHFGTSRSRSAVGWQGVQTLSSVIETQLGPLESSSQQCPARILDKDLTAANLVKYQDVHIRWVFDMTDHLKLTSQNGTLTLYVFEYKIWIKNNMDFPERCPVPQDVLEELMMTLNILFPIGCSDTTKLLRGFNKVQIQDMGNCGVQKSFDPVNFRLWRARMNELDILLNAPMRGFRQVYRLDKNMQNIMSVVLFWVSGVAVLFLTIISSVCGIMSLQVSQEAYRLAIAQACADSDVRDGMPQYCGRR